MTTRHRQVDKKTIRQVDKKRPNIRQILRKIDNQTYTDKADKQRDRQTNQKQRDTSQIDSQIVK